MVLYKFETEYFSALAIAENVAVSMEGIAGVLEELFL